MMTNETFLQSRAQLEARQRKLFWLVSAGCVVPLLGVDLMAESVPCAVPLAPNARQLPTISVSDLDVFYLVALRFPDHVSLAWTDVHKTLPDVAFHNLRDPFESLEHWQAEHAAAVRAIKELQK